jgi:hypothetical protein
MDVYKSEEDVERQKLPVAWTTRLLLRFWPRIGIRRIMRVFGVDGKQAERVHEVFRRLGTVDLFPLESGSRGFVLVLDRQIALYFYQDGDAFAYDGFEIGEYEKGDVRLFDRLPVRKPFDDSQTLMRCERDEGEEPFS